MASNLGIPVVQADGGAGDQRVWVRIGACWCPAQGSNLHISASACLLLAVAVPADLGIAGHQTDGRAGDQGHWVRIVSSWVRHCQGRHIHPAQWPSAPCLACSAVIPTPRPRGAFSCGRSGGRRSRGTCGGGSGGDLPPAYWPHGSPPGWWCRWGSDARRSSANVRLPATAQVHTVQPFALDGLPGTPPAGHWRWWVVGRAFGACCFAGKLRSPARPPGDLAYPAGGGRRPLRQWVRQPLRQWVRQPYVIPYALGVRTPGFGG